MSENSLFRRSMLSTFIFFLSENEFSFLGDSLLYDGGQLKNLAWESFRSVKCQEQKSKKKPAVLPMVRQTFPPDRRSIALFIGLSNRNVGPAEFSRLAPRKFQFSRSARASTAAEFKGPFNARGELPSTALNAFDNGERPAGYKSMLNAHSSRQFYSGPFSHRTIHILSSLFPHFLSHYPTLCCKNLAWDQPLDSRDFVE